MSHDEHGCAFTLHEGAQRKVRKFTFISLLHVFLHVLPSRQEKPLFYFFFLGTTAPVGLGLAPWTSPLHFGFSRSYTFGRIPWVGDQLVARPLPVHKHRKTHTQINIHALSGIRTHDPGFQASEDSEAFIYSSESVRWKELPTRRSVCCLWRVRASRMIFHPVQWKWN
jgi:hypothetical protein